MRWCRGDVAHPIKPLEGSGSRADRSAREPALKGHITLFSPGFLGLTGPPEALEAAYKAFGVYREKVTTEESALGYLMNHPARTYLLDQEGRWVLSYAFGTPAEDIVHDIRQLLR